MKWNQCCKPHRHLSQLLLLWNKGSLNHYPQRLKVSFETQFLVCGPSFADTCYIASLCLTPQLFRQKRAENRWKNKTLQANFWALMKKVDSVIEWNCSFHVGFAIILQEKWALLNQRIGSVAATFPLTSLTEGQTFQGWRHLPCSSSSSGAPYFIDKKTETSQPK